MESWTFVHVRSHRDPRLQTTSYAAWTAAGNDAADLEAKRCLKLLSSETRRLYTRACMETSIQRGQLARVFTLQVRLLQHNVSSAVERTTANTTAALSPYEPVLRVPCLLTPSDFVPQQSSLMPERFMWVLRKFWFQQNRYECNEGYSLAEFCFALVATTGWVTPVNVASWKQENLPPQWRSKLLTAFVHEVDFADLVFCRPCFWKQCTTFQFAVKSCLHEQRFPFQLIRRKSLAYMRVFLEIPSFPVIPEAFKEYRSLCLAAVGARSWKNFKNMVFSPPTSARWDCPVQVSTPRDI